MAADETIQQKKKPLQQQVVIQQPQREKPEQKDFFAKQMQVQQQGQKREEQLTPLLEQRQKQQLAVKIAKKEVQVTQVRIPAPNLRSKLASMLSGISTGMQAIDVFFGKDGDYWYYRSPENLGIRMIGPKAKRRQEKKLAPILKESKAA